MTLEEELKATIDKLGQAFEAFKTAHDEEVAGIKKGMADTVTADKLLKINAQMDELIDLKGKLEKSVEDEKKHIDEIEKKLNRTLLPGLGGDPAVEQKSLHLFNVSLKSNAALLNRRDPAEQTIDDLRAYKAGFIKYLKSGKDSLEPDERKAMTVGADNEGGYLVSPDASGRIVTRIFETSPMRSVAAQQTISTNELHGIFDTDEATSGGWVSETGTRAATATPTLGKYIIPVHELFAMPEATQQLLDDASIDAENWLGDKVADKLTRVENAAFINGDGVGKPRGITSYPTAATDDDTRAWGTLQHVVTGVNGGFHATLPGDVLFDILGKFKQGYLANGRWATKRAVIALIRKFKEATTNAYIWQPGLQAGQPDRLLGYPIVMFEDLPAVGTGSLSMAFGDFRLSYQIVDRQGFRVIRDNLTNKPYVRFYTTRRVGGMVVQFEALKFIKFST